MNSWYSVTNAVKGGAAEIRIFEEIGKYGVTAKQFADDLARLQGARQIDLYINSNGGSVFDGITIANEIKRSRVPVYGHVEGMAASIASVIAVACKRLYIAENGYMLIHDPSGLVRGQESEMRRMAETLKSVKEGIITAYQQKCGKPREEIAAVMAEERLFTAQEAIAFGLADEITGAVQVAASLDLYKFTNRKGAATVRTTGDPDMDFDNLVSDYQTRNGCSYEEALNATRKAYPQLWGKVESTGGADTKATAGIETEFDKLVDRYQFENGCGYEEALTAIRTSHPTLWRQVEG